MPEEAIESQALQELLAGGKRGEAPARKEAPTVIGDIARIVKKVAPYTPFGLATLPQRKIFQHREAIIGALKKIGTPAADIARKSIQAAADITDPSGKSIVPRDFELTGEQEADAKKDLPPGLAIRQWADAAMQSERERIGEEESKLVADVKDLRGRAQIDPADTAPTFVPPIEGALGQDLGDLYDAFSKGKLDALSKEKIALQQGMQNLSNLREKEIELQSTRIEKMRDDEMARRQEEERIDGIQEASIRKMITEAQNVPDFWEDATTPKKIFAGIALTLGAVSGGLGPLAGLGGGVSTLVLDQLINKELDRQKLRYNQAKSLSQQVSNWYGQKRATFQNERMADQAWLDDIYGLTGEKIEGMKSRTDDRIKLAQLDQLAAEFGQKAIANKMALKKGMLELYEKETSVRYSRIENIPEDTPIHKLSPQLRSAYIPGIGFLHDPKDSSKIKESISNVKGMERSIDKLVKFAEKYKWTPLRVINRVDVKEAGAEISRLKAVIRIEVTGGGNISEYEQKILSDIASDPLKMFSLGIANKAGLEALKNAALRNLKIKLDSYGYTPWGNRSLLTNLDSIQSKGTNMRTFSQDQFDEFFGPAGAPPSIQARR